MKITVTQQEGEKEQKGFLAQDITGGYGHVHRYAEGSAIHRNPHLVTTLVL